MQDGPPSNSAGDDSITPPRGIRAESDGDDEAWEGEWEDEPNYLARRAAVVAVVVAAIAGVAVLAGQLLGGDDESASRSPASIDWNVLLVLDENDIQVVDRDSGDELDTFSSPIDLLDAQTVVTGSSLLALADSGQVVQTDLTDGSEIRFRSTSDATLLLAPGTSDLALIGSDTGGDITVIDPVAETEFDISDVAGLNAPLMFAREAVVNPGRTHLAIPVPNEFQSVVIDLDTQESSPLAGRVIAIGDDMTVTEQPAGSRSELEFTDFDGERLGSADVGTPVATLLRDDGRLLTVDAEGAVSIVADDGSIEEVGDLVDSDENAVPVTDGEVVADGSILLVTTDESVTMLDVDGTTIARADGRLSSTPTVGSTCVVVRAPGLAATVVDVVTGDVLAETEASFATASSVVGCTFAVGGEPPELFTEGEFIEADADSIVGVAPDGDGYIALDGDTTSYRTVSGDDEFELTDEPTVVRFAER